MSSAAEKAWSGLVRAALLGTERAEAGAMESISAADPRLASITPGLADRTPEARLLGTAGLLAQYRRVGGVVAVTAEPALTPAEPERARVCGADASAHLRLMLGGEHREALAEWLAELVAKNLIVAPEDIPRLLDAGRGRNLPRDLIVAAAGERGRWLAALNPAWHYAVAPVDDESVWQTGTSEARLALLRGMRARDPARALELLRSTWEAEASVQRALFLPALEVGLSMADEPFLEQVLDDRRKEVRSIAAGLLSRLPDSRLVARMTERVVPLLRIQLHGPGALARAFGRARVEVELPAACDAAMVRDGVEPKPPRGTGERAWWLAQMIAAVPPSLWQRDSGLTAEQCIWAAARSEWRELVVRGWSLAAARFGDADWAEALLGTWAEGERGIEPAPLAAALPKHRLEAVIARLIEAAEGEVSAREAGLVLAAEAAPTWSASLTRTVMLRLARLPDALDYGTRALLGRLALRLHGATAVAEVVQLGERAHGTWLELLHHRHAMLEALDR